MLRLTTIGLALILVACGPGQVKLPRDPDFNPNEDHSEVPEASPRDSTGVRDDDASRPSTSVERSEPENEGSVPRVDMAPTEPQIPEGPVVTFEIPAGLGRKPWNTPDNPVLLRTGQILRIINRDDTVYHALHGLGTPCRHSPSLRLDEAYDCEPFEEAFVSQDELYDHYSSRRTGREYLYIVVVD